jgi:DNA polymerase III subunit delta'
MLAELERHPHARAVLEPALGPSGQASHAYLFYGPGGSGKRAAARAMAAELLSEGSPDPASARARVFSGAHPDLTWVAPSGAHEILVSDIDAPVISAASKTPFEAGCRVFVIERVDELGDEAANRMLKTLEEPASFVHLILLSDRLAEVLPTIRSRCQLVRFDAPSVRETAAALVADGEEEGAALACARLALGDGERARELAGAEGRALRAAAERYARTALHHGQMAAIRPWADVLAAVRARGEVVRAQLKARADEELELVPRKEQKRVDTEWSERIRRASRRVETAALDLALQVVALWYADLAALAWNAGDLVRNVDRRSELESDSGLGSGSGSGSASGVDPQRLRAAIEAVEDTRLRFQLNVSEDLACESLGYRLERLLAA